VNRRYSSVAARAEHRCEYCRAPEVLFNFRFEVEHIVPKSKRGSDEDFNLALSCHGCNLFKSDAETGIDPNSNEIVVLFNPRRDQWDNHFEFDSESSMINGRTPIGRVTVLKLRINSELQLASRRWWIVLGLFP
jgi:HNH endonuclease